jgi:hypothetical protein
MRDFYAFILRLLELAGESLDSLSSLLENAEGGYWSNWGNIARDTCWNRSYFTTSKGYMGLGPQALQTGDSVCVLAGGKLPYILRPMDGFFQFVGDCYVYSIMEGEAVQRWSDEGLGGDILEFQIQ